MIQGSNIDGWRVGSKEENQTMEELGTRKCISRMVMESAEIQERRGNENDIFRECKPNCPNDHLLC